ncbi:iron chelate uptake ABC transporter family permease subunit [Alkalibaculum sp. M08DMB]|uniref:Iron chelate uptake ABC transporter family permease subunit n=1 Tax=Alkalibaculum sporogenes TaxID=2655001 RepID=A0A6A7K7T9_9FIRM|nr:iron chelate uptake ABC transporter family permease subunit [Alkalibaculum sporogenes]MPW25549.1 iron chelate uptake ABC transporter family permease subunit [Alkalibaculum sporogenes]
MESLILLLSDYTFQTVAIGSAILGLISGVLGTFAVLRKQSLLGDGVSHAALPGVVLGFILIGSKNTEFLLLGALLSGLLSTLLITTIVKYSRIKFDSALALIMSVFFGLGLVLLTYVQKIPNANQAGLNRFIFGQASSLMRRDVNLMIICGSILLLLLIIFWKEFKIFTFDSEFAQSLGFSPKKLDLLLSLMTVTGIILGLQTVGVILMSAMLVAPAVAARQWTNKLSVMAFLGAIFGAISGIFGTAVSSFIPKLPTGPTIVLFASLIVLISILLAPGRGILHRLYRQKHNRSLNIERRAENDSTI